jgi:hypothetical protein
MRPRIRVERMLIRQSYRVGWQTEHGRMVRLAALPQLEIPFPDGKRPPQTAQGARLDTSPDSRPTVVP